jgi:hypothetical protein
MAPRAEYRTVASARPNPLIGPTLNPERLDRGRRAECQQRNPRQSRSGNATRTSRRRMQTTNKKPPDSAQRCIRRPMMKVTSCYCERIQPQMFFSSPSSLVSMILWSSSEPSGNFTFGPVVICLMHLSMPSGLPLSFSATFL